jgi:CDP-4-dehydro-6-deoxyglucose reductase
MPTIQLMSGKSFNSIAGSSILESAAISNVFLPYSCKLGQCSTCKCKVIQGKTTILKAETGLKAIEKEEGWILSCVRVAETDVLLEVEDLDELTVPESKTLPCRITSIEKINLNVIRILLRMPPSSEFKFLSGQYIQLIGPSGVRRSYSLANSNWEENILELHIQAVEGGVMSEYWFKKAKVDDLLRLNGPFGTFFLRPGVTNRDLIFLATGTGFAPVKSMLETLENQNFQFRPRSVNVFWGGRKIEDLYWDLTQFSKKINIIPVLTRPHADWTGATGYVQQAVVSRFPDLNNATVYACGSINMIKASSDVLIQAGLPISQFYSDAFLCSST